MTNLELIQIHHESTRACSVMHHMKDVSPTYEKIISKGKEIVPDILSYLENNDYVGMSIMMLLWDILKITPYKPEKIKNDKNEEIKGFVGFDVEEAKQAWIEWGKKEKLI